MPSIHVHKVFFWKTLEQEKEGCVGHAMVNVRDAYTLFDLGAKLKRCFSNISDVLGDFHSTPFHSVSGRETLFRVHGPMT